MDAVSSPSTWSGAVAEVARSGGTAVVTTEGSWSGPELLAHAAGAAAWLDSIGAREGAPVGALVTSTAAAFALIVGATAPRRPLAPLGPRLTARELTACVVASG